VGIWPVKNLLPQSRAVLPSVPGPTWLTLEK